MLFHLHYEVVTQWLSLHPQWAGLFAFIISFSECVVLLGTIIPGSVTMTAVGILIGSGVLPASSTLLWAISGAILGDGLGYFLGYYFKNGIRKIWPFSRYPAALLKGQAFILKHGRKSVFIGRFIGPIRAIIPVVAGLFDMQPKNYFLASIPAAILWAPVYMLPGILLGAISLEMSSDVATVLIVAVLALLTGLWFLIKGLTFLYHKTYTPLAHFFERQWLTWEAQSSKAWLCYLLRYESSSTYQGQLLLAWISLLLLFSFILLSLAVFQTSIFVSFNEAVYHLFRGIRTTSLDKIMVIITSFGYLDAFWPAVFIFPVYLLFKRKYLSAIHFFGGVGLLGVLEVGIKKLFFFPRPPGITAQLTSSSFPSGHVSLTVMFYGLLLFMLSRTIKQPQRHFVYTIYFCIVGLMGLSRLYLNAHWPTDIVGGILFGGCTLSMSLISLRRYPNQLSSLSFKQFLWICILGVTLPVGWYLTTHYHSNLQRYQSFWPQKTISQEMWWKATSSSNILSHYRNNRLGHPTELLNIQFAGPLSSLQHALQKQGWQSLHQKETYITPLEKIMNERIAQHCTLLPPVYDDQPPVFEMLKWVAPNSPPLVLRLWSSHIDLLPHHISLWVGTMHYDEIQKYFLFVRHKAIALPVEDKFQDLIPALDTFDWRMKKISQTPFERKILLIKMTTNEP